MKNVDEVYEKYYNAYKSDYDSDDELKEDKKKTLDYKQFKLNDKISQESKLIELPKWLSSKNGFNEARKLINDIRADTNKVKSSSGNEKVFNDLNGLINDIPNKKTTRKIDKRKFKKKYNDIVEDVEKILNRSKHTRSQDKMVEILSQLKELAPYKQLDTTNMPELESEESAAQRRNQQGKGLKILTPNQMLSRLPISLAQLKAGNNSEKLKNEIRQLLYSLYRSKKLTKQIYKSLVDII